MRRRMINLMLPLVGFGCATRPPPASHIGATPPVQVTQSASAEQDKALLPLDRIEPRPAWPATRPATGPAAAPVEAVRLYAKARIALLDGDRAAAIRDLQGAAALDPDSYELHLGLGRAYGDQGGADDKAAGELETAAALEPDHLDLQVALGRIYLQQ